MVRHLVINLYQLLPSKQRKYANPGTEAIDERKRIGRQSLGFTRMFASYTIRTVTGRRAGRNYI